MTKRRWRNCEECDKNIKRFYRTKGKTMCYNCYISKLTLIMGGNKGRKPLSKEQALNKVYLVKSYKYGKNDKVYINAFINVPKVLAGKKVQLKIIEEDGSKKTP